MDTTRLVRPLVGVCAVLCIADLVVMLSLAVYGGVTEKLWFTIACALSLTLLPLQVIPSLCIPGARWKTLGIAGSGMIGAFLATRALGTLTSMIFSLRAMEPATVPVVEAGHGQYHHTHEVQLPDGRIDTVGGWKGADVGDILEVRYDVAGEHWTIYEPTMLGLVLQAVVLLLCLAWFLFFLTLTFSLAVHDVRDGGESRRDAEALP
ncbi:MAG: hypothetical protein ACTHV2_01470 [Brachybacterium sp.]|uniref:hypothetical protein n=1 Tax=Brachybacterium sp. TaxID=1891286 RepID=UPI00264C3690|nr:hypothetical protein [Brachybacterium sp.]MDN6329547.1 hypothetical protein [Brachybacterium sp.]MDN6400624.1 hypothetical protein [Brachybacterium sp.]